MKKTILLLLLACIFVLTGFAQANNSDEKFDLTPKIKKGDSWKMVVDVGNHNLTWTENNERFNAAIGFLFSSELITQIKAKSEWDVECVNATKDNISLKFTLKRIIVGHLYGSGEKEAYSFNDTDYPLNLSDEQIENINQYIGKTFTCDIPGSNANEVKITKNDFRGKSITISNTPFINSKYSVLLSVTYVEDVYSYVGPPMVKLLLELWRSLLPQKPVGESDKWITHLGTGDKRVDFVTKLKSYNPEFTTLEIEKDGVKEDVIVNNRLGIPGIFDFMTGVKIYVYDSGIGNSSVAGDYNNNLFNGVGTFKINYPVTTDEIKVNVTNGKFFFPVDLREPIYGTLRFKDKKTDLFLNPGMHVNLEFHKGERFPEVTGRNADDLNCIFHFQKERFYFGYSTEKYSKQRIIEETNSYKRRINDILKQFEGRISEECKSFIQTETIFSIGYRFVESIEDIEREKVYNSRSKDFNIERASENAQFLKSYTDSLRLVGLDIHCSNMYHAFLKEYLIFKQRMFLSERGRRRDRENYKENILFAGVMYVGYPYYYSCYKLLQDEIYKGNYKKIRKELDEFASLPCNPGFINSLNKLVQEMRVIDAGQSFPFQEIKDMNGEMKILPKGDFCVVDISSSYRTVDKPQYEQREALTTIIKNDKRINRINYVVIRPAFARGEIKETESNDTILFTYIYLPKDDVELFKKINLISEYNRVLLLDKELRIIDNNIGKISKYSGHNLLEIINRFFQSKNQPTSQAGTRRLLLVILISVVGFGFLSWLIIRVRTKQIAKREEARRKLSELELRAIRSQMNPHFIFNAMGSIQNLINQNNIKNANLYLASFARLMRMVLTNSNKKLVSLSHELELLKHYLELEQLRVDFQFDISFADNVDPETEEIPGMLVQPFVENAVIHGITPKGKGTISVKFSKSDGYLVCEIIDDGVGINTKGIGNGNGIAMKLSEKRLNLLNSQLHEKLRLTVENRMDNEKTEGTKITLLIPIG